MICFSGNANCGAPGYSARVNCIIFNLSQVMIHHHSSVVEVLIRNLLNARQVLVAGVMGGFGGKAAADINRMHVRKPTNFSR